MSVFLLYIMLIKHKTQCFFFLHMSLFPLLGASAVDKCKCLLSSCGFLDWATYSVLILVQISSLFWAPSICVDLQPAPLSLTHTHTYTDTYICEQQARFAAEQLRTSEERQKQNKGRGRGVLICEIVCLPGETRDEWRVWFWHQCWVIFQHDYIRVVMAVSV